MSTMPTEEGPISPAELRRRIRANEWTGPLPSPRTVGAAPADSRAYAKMNLVVLPLAVAFDFVLFCQRNARAYAIADITEPGSPVPRLLAPDADVRTDLPRYRVFSRGSIIDEPHDINAYWHADSVAFLIGSSSCFDWALRTAGVQYETLGAYETALPCLPSRCFAGNMVVTARRFASSQDAVRAIQISSRHPAFHGAPVHMGPAQAIGIADLAKPDYPLGTMPAQTASDDTHTLYWGCGILSASLTGSAQIEQLITHYPGRLMVTDRLIAEMAVF
ncbi:MAG: DUF1445 domain-containing protein [Burkholderiales bacterium]|nr:DUF1445 domain-containing protein [Burkholderiales bacterium]